MLMAICRNHSGIPYTHYVIDDGDARCVKLLAACGLAPDGKSSGGYWVRKAGENETSDRGSGDVDALLSFSESMWGKR